ncbi:MAG: hypothetical protein UR98_C0005G0020 [Parcubacteria group bacterium GW2011_GWA1_36_12]|nr:MAG: hypothetical protein UR98_C0005G0020 [Parcubacteria group bacterium GW2011_GWA1_36_12]
MANDNGLIDELEKLQTLKKEIEKSEEELKEKIMRLAKEKGTDILFGTKMKCSIKEYDKIVYPEDKTQIINLMKQKGIYDSYSILSYMRLNSAIIKGNIDQDVIDLTKKEKAFRLSLKDI